MKRICRITIALCLPLLFCGPVMAQHSGPYVGAFIGGNMLMTAEGKDDQGSFSLEFNPALQGSAVLGWDLEPGNPMGEGRIELEYTRRSNQVDQMKFAQGYFQGSGNLVADSLLINGFGVFRDNRPWSPYAGAGIGAARIEASDLKVSGQPMGSGSAIVFAYQLGAGVDLSLTERISLDLGYRFFSSTRPSFSEAGGRKFDIDYMSHSAMLGLRVGF